MLPCTVATLPIVKDLILLEALTAVQFAFLLLRCFSNFTFITTRRATSPHFRLKMEINLNEPLDSCSMLPRKLSHLTFGEIQDLKKKLGLKQYNDVLAGRKREKKRNFHRENKNRPRERSSKMKIPKIISLNANEKKYSISRDPRFESFTGTFNQDKFDDSYKFLHKMEKKEQKKLKKLSEENNGTEAMESSVQPIKEKPGYALNERKKRKMKMKMEAEKERTERIKLMMEGKRPYYKKKSEKRLEELVKKFETLKEKGGLRKHIQKKRIKNKSKDGKRLTRIEIKSNCDNS